MPTLTRGGRNLDVLSTHHAYIDTYTGPASYVTGGDSLVPGDLKLGVIDAIFFTVARSGTTIRLLVYDKTNEKVLWFVPNTGAEVAAATDLSGFTADMLALGKS